MKEQDDQTRVAPLDAGAATTGSTAAGNEPSPSLLSGSDIDCGQFLDDYDPYDDEEYRDKWCRDFDAHKGAHEFCADHQAAWCRTCDRYGCPQCVDDPHCPECHCALFEDEHDWDCSYYGEDEE